VSVLPGEKQVRYHNRDVSRLFSASVYVLHCPAFHFRHGQSVLTGGVPTNPLFYGRYWGQNGLDVKLVIHFQLLER
jgi:hypothetical protein